MTRARLFVLTAIGLLTMAGPGPAASPDPLEALGLILFESGIKAPDFTLPDLNGNSVSLLSEARSATLLVFWSSW